MTQTSWMQSLMGGTSDASETVKATVSALLDAGWYDVGPGLGERPYTYCRFCRIYQTFNYYSKNRQIVTACKVCGVVPMDERALTIERVSL